MKSPPPPLSLYFAGRFRNVRVEGDEEGRQRRNFDQEIVEVKLQMTRLLKGPIRKNKKLKG